MHCFELLSRTVSAECVDSYRNSVVPLFFVGSQMKSWSHMERAVDDLNDKKKMVFLTNESANKAEIDILSARDTTRPGP